MAWAIEPTELMGSETRRLVRTAAECVTVTDTTVQVTNPAATSVSGIPIISKML